MLGRRKPMEGGTYCFGCIRLRETEWVAVLGRGVLVEIKPIFCDCKTNLILGDHGAEGNISRLFSGHGAERKETHCVGL